MSTIQWLRGQEEVVGGQKMPIFVHVEVGGGQKNKREPNSPNIISSSQTVFQCNKQRLLFIKWTEWPTEIHSIGKRTVFKNDKYIYIFKGNIYALSESW